MKRKFSSSWVSSKQIRKQRKYRYNAPLHIRHKFLSAHLSQELRKKHAKRNVPIKKGDEVLIMRGSFKGKKGKILEIDLKKSRVVIESINRQKLDGTKVNVYFSPSNLKIQILNLEDGKRFKTNQTPDVRKTNKEYIKNAPDTNTSK